MDSTAMSWREHIRQNMRLALPLMIGQLATIGIWTSDTIAMGWIDSSPLAAGALASRFYQPFSFSRSASRSPSARLSPRGSVPATNGRYGVPSARAW